MTEANETVFNDIRSFVQKEVNRVISDHLQNKNYNVNEAQLWTNICDDVHIHKSIFLRPSPVSTKISSSSPTASSCRKPIVA